MDHYSVRAFAKRRKSRVADRGTTTLPFGTELAQTGVRHKERREFVRSGRHDVPPALVEAPCHPRIAQWGWPGKARHKVGGIPAARSFATSRLVCEIGHEFTGPVQRKAVSDILARGRDDRRRRNRVE